MIRRSRISVRPNVKPTGRFQTVSRDASADHFQPPQASADSTPSEGSEVTADELKPDTPIAALQQTNEEASQSSYPSKHGAEAASKISDAQDSTSTSATSGPQRRKRFTALPNLAKPRSSPATSRTPKSISKSPVKLVTPSEPETSTPTASEEPSLQIPVPVRNPRLPGRRRLSGGGRQAKVQPIVAAPLQNDQEMQKEGVLEDVIVPLSVQQGETQHTLITSQPDITLVHENPPARPAVEDVVVQQESDSGTSPSQNQMDLLGERLYDLKTSSKILKSLKSLNDPADIVRLAQARKLRELLKKEMNKRKEDKKKPKMGMKERKAPKDHTKMTMRELIYYLPNSNPMKSFTEEEQKAPETVLDDSPTPTSSKTPAPPTVQETVVEDVVNEEDEERIEETQPEEEEPLLVPRVKVAEDGSLIIDEESLTVQVSRAKGPNLAEDRDPIFERGSTTTYSSFRKGTYTKPWSNGETEMFYLAISMVGTDFSMIGQLFPHRGRIEIKNKFKKEERNNSWRIDKAFKEKRRLDLEFFKKLMEQILKKEENKKNKNKELVKLAKSQRKIQRKVRAAKRKEMESSSDSESDVVAGEKENEDLSNDGGSDTTPKKRRGRGMNTPDRRINRANGESMQAEIDEPEDFENLTSDGHSQDDNRYKNPAIKPAQLKGRPQRPIPDLSHRWGNRRPVSKGRENGASAGEESKMDKSPKVSSASIKEKKQSAVLLELEDLEEEPDLSAVQEQIFNKPTRSGRIPKLSQHVIQAAEEEDEEELSDLPVSSKVHGWDIKAPGRRAKLKPGPRLKKGMLRRGKSRLVTLLASGTEDDDEEEEEEEVEDSVLSQEVCPSNPEDENQVFVPMSLRPAPPVNSEVVETMEEDVIEFLDPDHMEVCKEINNEAAQTLLTIGNSAQMIQTSEMPCTSGNYIVEESSIVHEEVIHEEVITETAIESETKDDFSSCKTQIPELSVEETSTQKEEPIKSQTTDPAPIRHETQVPPSKRGRFSKPKPNIGQGLRTRRAPQQQISSEIVTGSLGTSKSPSSTEQDKTAIQEDGVPVDHLPDSSNIYPEVLQPETSSERSPKVIPERGTKEDNGSVSSLRRKDEDIITDENIKDQEEAISEPQLTQSVNESPSSSEPSKPVRRYRGPKPKPNLTQTSRRPQTQSTIESSAAQPSMTTFTKGPEEGAVNIELDVSESTAQQEGVLSIESAETVKDVTPPAVSETASRQKAVVMLDENNRADPEEVREGSSVTHPGCESEDVRADPRPEESVFILSLTEIPPALNKGAGIQTELLPPAAVSYSPGQSASESREISHLLLTDALVPVSEDEEKKSEQGDVGKSRKGELKRKTPTSTSHGSSKDEAEHDVERLGSLGAEGTDDEKEHMEKKRKIPERTRRAKLQVKPTPVLRRSAQGGDAKEDTAALSFKQTTSLPISVQKTVPAAISSMDDSKSATISDRDATTDLSATSTNTCSPVSEEPVQEGSSQDIMGKVDLSGKETVDLTSESDSPGVSQITPISTSGPLTRPGRRPKGFLSFISSKSTPGPPATHRGVKPGPPKPAVNTTRPERKRIAAGPATTATNPGVKQPLPTPVSTTASVIQQNSEEEPTSVSKYFFSDIFTEVDELEDMD